jgi:putative effector of murein hydrolase
MVLPLVLGFASMLPFLMLEFRYQPGELPLVLFGTLWLLGAAVVALLLPVLRNRPRPGALLVRVSLSILVACVWARILMDQMPCFLGVPNCD